jgi:8-oxo-dGTP pyrophosphatase MutT (NUDIX family)
MDGGKEAWQHYRSAVNKKPDTYVNVYLLLKQNNKVLLQLRKNTSYCDGMWSFVSGHVEDGESATEAMIREAYEEIGIELLPSQLKVVHVMHRKTNRLNVDLFFECPSWQGAVKNREPDKCEKLEFFSLDSFPPHVIDCTASALQCILKGIFYSELVWDR